MKINIYVLSTILFLSVISGFNNKQVLVDEESSYAQDIFQLFDSVLITEIIEDNNHDLNYYNGYFEFFECKEDEEYELDDCCITMSPKCEIAFETGDVSKLRKIKKSLARLQKEKPKMEKKVLKTALKEELEHLKSDFAKENKTLEQLKQEKRYKKIWLDKQLKIARILDLEKIIEDLKAKKK